MRWLLVGFHQLIILLRAGLRASSPTVRKAAMTYQKPHRSKPSLTSHRGRRSSGRRLVTLGIILGAATAPRLASAATYRYVDWTSADIPGGTAAGTISLPDGSTVTVTFAALNQDASAGNLYGAQVNGGTNYWNPATPFISAQVENAPPDTDILRLAGGQNQIYRVTLSEPIKDPIMAVVSLGQSSVSTTYDFDSPFTIVSQGRGYWGGTATSLSQLPEDVLRGTEGHGTIQFVGTFSTFSWTVPTPENWHGFTFGIRTTERLEPSDAGAPDAAPEAGPPEDIADAGGGTSGGAASDAGSSLGGGPIDSGGSGTSSCGCSTVGERSRAAVPVALLLGALALVAAGQRRLVRPKRRP